MSSRVSLHEIERLHYEDREGLVEVPAIIQDPESVDLDVERFKDILRKMFILLLPGKNMPVKKRIDCSYGRYMALMWEVNPHLTGHDKLEDFAKELGISPRAMYYQWKYVQKMLAGGAALRADDVGPDMWGDK